MDKLLARRSYRVRLSSNGREALVLAGQGVFDLILLDVHMPELDYRGQTLDRNAGWSPLMGASREGVIGIACPVIFGVD